MKKVYLIQVKDERRWEIDSAYMSATQAEKALPKVKRMLLEQGFTSPIVRILAMGITEESPPTGDTCV